MSLEQPLPLNEIFAYRVCLYRGLTVKLCWRSLEAEAKQAVDGVVDAAEAVSEMASDEPARGPARITLQELKKLQVADRPPHPCHICASDTTLASLLRTVAVQPSGHTNLNSIAEQLLASVSVADLCYGRTLSTVLHNRDTWKNWFLPWQLQFCKSRVVHRGLLCGSA